MGIPHYTDDTPPEPCKNEHFWWRPRTGAALLRPCRLFGRYKRVPELRKAEYGQPSKELGRKLAPLVRYGAGNRATFRKIRVFGCIPKPPYTAALGKTSFRT